MSAKACLFALEQCYILVYIYRMMKQGGVCYIRILWSSMESWKFPRDKAPNFPGLIRDHMMERAHLLNVENLGKNMG